MNDDQGLDNLIFTGLTLPSYDLIWLNVNISTASPLPLIILNITDCLYSPVLSRMFILTVYLLFCGYYLDIVATLIFPATGLCSSL